MRQAFMRVRVQLIGIFAIFLITVMAFAIVRPDLLQPREPAWTITGNAIIDNSLFDKQITKQSPCSGAYEPICGTDGYTYQNFCQATKAGVDILHDGECLNGWVAE